MNANVYFCGGGGSTLGLHRAGLTTLGFDNWSTALDTHRSNGFPALDVDLSDPTNDAELPDAPVAWFSPPCVPFSSAGKQAGDADPRDGMPWTLRIVERTKPALVVVENVVGFTYPRHADQFARVLDDLRRLGYDVDWRILNAADFGVPQTRRRLFVVARCDGAPIVWPTPTHSKDVGLFTARWVSIVDALPDLLDRLDAYAAGVWSLDSNADRGEGCEARHGDRPLQALDRPAPAMVARTDTRWRWTLRGSPLAKATVRRLDEPAPTVTFGHDLPRWALDELRVTVDVADLAVLQGLPRDWFWRGSKTAVARQVGNAVPPVLATAILSANRLDEEVAA